MTTLDHSVSADPDTGLLRAMRWAGYAWEVITGAVTALVAFGIVTMFPARFERIVIDLLMLIYIAIRGQGYGHGMVLVEQAKQDRNRFIELMKAIGAAQQDSRFDDDAVRQDDTAIHRSLIKGYIGLFFLWAVSILVIFNLLGALL